MSSTSGSHFDQTDTRSRGHCCGKWGRNSNWSGTNIAAMVLGFIFFWPVGLLILYWILKGRSVTDMPQWFRNKWASVSGGFGQGSESDNVVFNEFQQTQYDRIREIGDEIKDRSRRFTEFRANAKRRADEEEFNRFMSEVPARDGG